MGDQGDGQQRRRAQRRDAAQPGATIGSVAHEMGYATPFALSTAFKRVRGVSPQQHRAAALGGVSSARPASQGA